MKTREEITNLTFEDMREVTISTIARSEVMLDALKAARMGTKGDEEMSIVQQIRNYETQLPILENDLKIIELRLNDKENGKEGTCTI